MKRAHVLQIASYGGPYSGGFISSLLHLNRVVGDQLGLGTVCVFSAVAKGRPWVDLFRQRGIPVLFLDRRLPLWKRTQALVDIGKRYNVVLLHSHFGAFDVDATLAARRLRAGVVWHMHSGLWGRYNIKQRIKDLVKVRIIGRKWVDCVIAVSEPIAEVLRRRGFPSSMVKVIHNGVDVGRFLQTGGGTKSALRRHYNIPEEERVFLLFGWHPTIKGVDLFVDAISMLERSGQRLPLCIIVSGEHNAREIKTMVQGANWARVITPLENVAELYASVDCFICASRSEAFSFAICEAMASSLVVIAPDYLHPIFGQAGGGFFTFRSEDVHDLASVLGHVMQLTEKELRERGETNRRFVEANLTVENWAANISDLYRSILLRKPSC